MRQIFVTCMCGSEKHPLYNYVLRLSPTDVTVDIHHNNCVIATWELSNHLYILLTHPDKYLRGG